MKINKNVSAFSNIYPTNPENETNNPFLQIVALLEKEADKTLSDFLNNFNIEFDENMNICNQDSFKFKFFLSSNSKIQVKFFEGALKFISCFNELCNSISNEELNVYLQNKDFLNEKIFTVIIEPILLFLKENNKAILEILGHKIDFIKLLNESKNIYNFLGKYKIEQSTSLQNEFAISEHDTLKNKEVVAAIINVMSFFNKNFKIISP